LKKLRAIDAVSQLSCLISAGWFPMPENASANFTPRFQGATFDDMVGALTKGFGSFDAWRDGRDKPLDWKVGFWGDESLSLVSNQDSGGWGARTAHGTPETLAIIVPRTGALDVTLGRSVIEGTPGRLLLANNLEPERISVRSAAPVRHTESELDNHRSDRCLRIGDPPDRGNGLGTGH
jgi:hypothetical protein